MKSLIYDIEPNMALYKVQTESDELGYFYRDDIKGKSIQIDKQTYYGILSGYFLSDEFLESFFDMWKIWKN